ncbi:hypothetical protein ACK3TF_004229 [Chlorella vulgaris]
MAAGHRISLFQPTMDSGPPLPGNPPLPPPHNGYGAPQPPTQQQKRGKKRGRRGSGLGPQLRPFKAQQRAPQQLGFFGQVPNLQDLRQENRRRTQLHYEARGGFQQPAGPQHAHPQQQPQQQHGRHRRSRFKGPNKQPKFPQAAPRRPPLTPAAGNPLDTPANVGAAAAAAAGVDKLEAEGLQSGLDWYGTNEDSAALFLAGQQLTTSDSEGEDDLDDEEGSEGEAHSGGGDHPGGGGDHHGAPGGGGAGDGALPRHLQARLVEQEAYIAELEDQNLRLREQLEMVQQEMEEARAHGGRAPADSEEGFAEHSEGSLPDDLSLVPKARAQPRPRPSLERALSAVPATNGCWVADHHRELSCCSWIAAAQAALHAMSSQNVLPAYVLKHISDRLYEKRKLAALEVEQVVKQLAAAGRADRIDAVIGSLTSYATSSQANARKGGLLCLAATAVALAGCPPGEMRPPNLLQRIVPPILASFTDQDSRVRYYAIESLWNVAKSTRDSFLQVFPEVFESLFRLCSDADTNVQNAASFLDNLVKDIVAESHDFSVAGFVPLLQEYLEEFLLELQTSGGGADVSRIALILAQQLQQRQEDPAAQLTALRWLHTLVQLAPRQLLPHTAAVLTEVLPCLGHEDSEISTAARQVNADLLDQLQQQQQGQQGQQGQGQRGSSALAAAAEGGLDSQALLATVSKQLEGDAEVSKLEALQWVNALLSRDARLLQDQQQLLLAALCDALSAASDRVVTESLAVLASVADQRGHFPAVMATLLDCFRGAGGARLLQRRGGLIIQQLSQRLGGLRVYKELSRLLQEEEDVSFAGGMVQALNLILLTSSSLQELRGLLQASLRSAEAADVFVQLFASWSHSCAASLALALLAQAYSLACELLAVMAQEPLSMRPETAVELSQLVSLLEAPAFAPLRLQLLQPAAHPALLRAAHGVLMLLPQGDAFRTLQTRLQSVPIMALLANKEQQPQRGGGGLDAPAFGGSSGSFSALDLNAGAEPPPASPTVRPRQSPQQQQTEVAQSPPQWQLVQQRAPLIEDKRLVQLFKSRVSRLP